MIGILWAVSWLWSGNANPAPGNLCHFSFWGLSPLGSSLFPPGSSLFAGWVCLYSRPSLSVHYRCCRIKLEFEHDCNDEFPLSLLNGPRYLVICASSRLDLSALVNSITLENSCFAIKVAMLSTKSFFFPGKRGARCWIRVNWRSAVWNTAFAINTCKVEGYDMTFNGNRYTSPAFSECHRTTWRHCHPKSRLVPKLNVWIKRSHVNSEHCQSRRWAMSCQRLAIVSALYQN